MNYYVRVYCEDCQEYKRTVQTTLDSNWVPSGCEAHTIKDFVVSNEVSDFKASLDKDELVNVNYNFLGLHKEEIIDSKGCLTTVNMYRNYDSETETFSDLAVKDEFVYYFNAQDLVTHRNETITWYREDDSVGATKSITKHYNLNDAIKEGVKRRKNLVDKAKAYGLATIEGTHESGLPNSYYWFSTMLNEVELYLSGTKKQDLIDFIDDSTESYITQTIKDTMTDILDYWSE